METLAVKLVDGVAVEVIVGSASWAMTNLGGQWVEVVANNDEPETVIGIGDRYVDGSFVRESNLSERITARESAIAKLSALGLDAGEITALLGL